MNLRRDSYRKLGTATLKIGQGIIIAILCALLLNGHVSTLLGLLGISAGIACIFGGISLIQKASHKHQMKGTRK